MSELHLSPPVTVAQLLDAYEVDWLPQKAPTTAKQLKGLYVRIRRELGDIPLRDLTPLILRRWRDFLTTQYKPGMVRRYLETLSGPLTAAVREYGWLDSNPMHKIRKPAVPPGRVRWLTAEERQRLLAACMVSRNRQLFPLVMLALATGARKMELLTLTWEDVDLERGMIRFEVTKNKEKRGVPVLGEALTILRHQAVWKTRSKWVFPRADGEAPVKVDVAWQHACRRAGVENFRFHDLRHTAASYLAMSGASTLEIAEVLGHKTLQLVKRYAHLSPQHTAEVLAKMAAKFLPPLGGQDGPPGDS